jgi:hypothetical protein
MTASVMDRLCAYAERVPCQGQIVLRVEGRTTGPATRHTMEVLPQDADGKATGSVRRLSSFRRVNPSSTSSRAPEPEGSTDVFATQPAQDGRLNPVAVATASGPRGHFRR